MPVIGAAGVNRTARSGSNSYLSNGCAPNIGIISGLSSISGRRLDHVCHCLRRGVGGSVGHTNTPMAVVLLKTALLSVTTNVHDHYLVGLLN